MLSLQEPYLWITFIAGGYLLGGIMFSYWLPKQFLKKDVCKLSDDCNPGAANVFSACGIPIGTLCLILDLTKGILPVFFACRKLDTADLLFSAVMLAPVLGHAYSPYMHFKGGKCISTAFGVLIAIVPATPIVLILAGTYIFFSIVIKIYPNRRRSIFAFAFFAIFSLPILMFKNKLSIAIGCAAISAVAILKHLKPIKPLQTVPENTNLAVK